MTAKEQLSDVAPHNFEDDENCSSSKLILSSEHLQSSSDITSTNAENTVGSSFRRKIYLNMKHDLRIKSLNSHDIIYSSNETTILSDKNTVMTNPSEAHTNKMYINPRFLKMNHEYPTNLGGGALPPSVMKPSVHINPKVLAQFMQSNLHTNSISEGSKLSEEHLASQKIQTVKTTLKPHRITVGSAVVGDSYLYCTKTKLVKQNIPIRTQCTNFMKSSDTLLQQVPDKLPMMESSSWPLMSVSRTKLVRGQIKAKRNNATGMQNIPRSPSVQRKALKLKIVRRPSVNSTLISTNPFKLVRKPIIQEGKNIKNSESPSKSKHSVYSQPLKLKTVESSSVSLPILSLSRTKLIRSPCKQRKSSVSSNKSDSRQLVSVSRTKLVRNSVKSRRSSRASISMLNVSDFARYRQENKSISSPCNLSSKSRRNSARTSTVTIRAAKAVRTKYKIIKSPLTRSMQNSYSNKASIHQESRYKIDRRLQKPSRRQKNVKKYSLQYSVQKEPLKLFQKRRMAHFYPQTKFGNRTWTKPLFPRKVFIRNKKLMRIGSSPGASSSKERKYRRGNLCLVQIGGVLYKTSKMKLSKSSPKSRTQDNKQQSQGFKKCKVPNGFVVSVRGNKFIMDSSGRSLVKVAENHVDSKSNEWSPVKRVDIGGVTFIQKSSNVLVRTNTHNARNVVSQAKQKSIAMLTKKLRKSNMPCIFYHRFGKCTKKEKDSCPYTHDPKHVAICRKFLQGCCEMNNCALSHDVGPEKMPTCKYFLEGCCVRDNCPYLHVKVNSKAAICKNFLRGYCPDGKKCKKRHTYLCPEFDKTGNCSKGKYCKYPHQTVVNKKKPKSRKVTLKIEHKIPPLCERKRYYERDEAASVEHKTDTSGNEDVPTSRNEDLPTSSVSAGSDLEAKRLKLLKKVNDMKRNWLIAQSGADVTSDLSEVKSDKSEPETKRPKLGTLPAFIPLN